MSAATSGMQQIDKPPRISLRSSGLQALTSSLMRDQSRMPGRHKIRKGEEAQRDRPQHPCRAATWTDCRLRRIGGIDIHLDPVTGLLAAGEQAHQPTRLIGGAAADGGMDVGV